MKLGGIKKGDTSILMNVWIGDTTGAAKTGLVYNSAGMTLYYSRDAGSATAVTLATMTLGTWVSGGFIEISSANMPGWYQIGLPNAAFATGSRSVAFHLKGTGIADVPFETGLITLDNQGYPDGVIAGACTGTPTSTSITASIGTAYPTASSLIGRVLVFTSGSLKGQAQAITAYSASGATGTMTTAAFTGAPSAGDTFLIV